MKERHAALAVRSERSHRPRNLPNRQTASNIPTDPTSSAADPPTGGIDQPEVRLVNLISGIDNPEQLSYKQVAPGSAVQKR